MMMDGLVQEHSIRIRSAAGVKAQQLRLLMHSVVMP